MAPLDSSSFLNQSQMQGHQTLYQGTSHHYSQPPFDQLNSPNALQMLEASDAMANMDHLMGQHHQRNENEDGNDSGTFDPTDYAAQGLDPSAFSRVSFQMPSFLTGGPAGQFVQGPAVVDPDHGRMVSKQAFPSIMPQQQTPVLTSDGTYAPNPNNPIYGLYGSSVVGVNPDQTPFVPLESVPHASGSRRKSATSSESPFNPQALGLPQARGGNFPGLYSSSGFDMIDVLARVAARPNPQVNIGPVDTSCSFLVVDARKYDFPIVFASSTFSKLTGYEGNEIIGRNCRFLQAPDGNVALGSRRKYTDGNAAYHMKTHILSGKESQASVINYRKNGEPFINLVTIIPITWDTDEIAYFVGFQVDLVDQPNAILEKMKDGTYVVNYSLLGNPSFGTSSSSRSDISDDTSNWTTEKRFRNIRKNESGHHLPTSPELLEIVGADQENGDDEGAKKHWFRMLLDHSDDFIHVVSLKGSLLYVSPSTARLLEYDPSELVGKPLSSFLHPSDVVPTMRDLKESSNAAAQPTVSLLYRIRRKKSGYVWMEAQGKLHLEQGKGRKCVILVGRERPVYRMSWSDLSRGGGLGDLEFWSKLSLDGMYLYSTPSVENVLGFTAEDMVGTSMYQLVPNEKATDVTKALAQAAAGSSVSLRHKLKNRKGQLVDVVSNFYPNARSGDHTVGGAATHPSVVCQTNELGSDRKRRKSQASLPSLPVPDGVASSSSPSLSSSPNVLSRSGIPSGASPINLVAASPLDETNGSVSDGSSAPSTFSAIPSTFKSLAAHPSMQSDNIFDELDTTRSTSWQYELHQLKIINKRLKEELGMLEAAKRKRKRKYGSMNSSGSPASGVRTCANCGRQDSPEWRRGPSGNRNLCNACGLRWSKAQQTSTSGSSASVSTNSNVTSMSPEGGSPVPGQMGSSQPQST